MTDFASVKARYLRDPIPVRLGGLAADLQLTLTLWLDAWAHARAHPVQRALLAHEAMCWSDRVLALSGLLTAQPAQR